MLGGHKGHAERIQSKLAGGYIVASVQSSMVFTALTTGCTACVYNCQVEQLVLVGANEIDVW